MAHTFKITDNGTDIFDFMATGRGIVAYEPTYGTGEYITETAIIRISATSDSGLSQAICDINNAFTTAKSRWDSQSRYLYYVYYSPSGADTGRSPILDGRVISVTDILGVSWANLDFDVTVQFTRADYWEGTTATKPYYVNSNGSSTGATGEVIVRNCNDGTSSTLPYSTRNNFLTLQDESKTNFLLDSTFPINITFLPGQGHKIAALYVTQFSVDSAVMSSTAYPAKLGWLEGEDASTAADSTGAAFSGGKYHAFTVSTGTTGTNIEWDIATWFPSAYSRILCGAKFTGTARVRPYVNINSVKTYGGTTILTGTNAWNIYQLGIMKVPPIDNADTELIYGSIKLGINVVITAGGTFNLDWLQSIPQESGMYIRFTESYAIGNKLQPDLEKKLYLTSKTNKTIGFITGYGATTNDIRIWGKSMTNGSISITPGRKNYLFFSWVDDSLVNNPHDLTNIIISYRPRWRYFHAS
jgi:hypothetical protein